MGSPSEQAIFMIKWAQEEYYLMHARLKRTLPCIETDLKDNVIRVAQKIEAEEAKRPGNGGGYQFITDILRCRLTATSPEDMKIKLGQFENIPGVQVIKYKPKFYKCEGADLRNVHVNFIWDNAFLCELQLRLGEMPALEEENHFLYEIERVETPLQFLDAWNSKLTKMAIADELFYQE